MEERIITKLAEQLAKYKDADLNVCFSRVQYDCPILSVEEQDALMVMQAFPRQLELKRLVGKRLDGSFENDQVNEWIVHKWGGITKFDVSNRERITGFRDHLAAGQLTRREFDRISSLSKIASFVNPGEYFVYDSRVAFALDGLLLDLLRKDSKLRVKYFPLPQARGRRDEIMRRMIENEHPGTEYLTRIETYAKYNTLILALAETEPLKKELPSCWVEMLLFYLGRTDGEIERLFDFSTIKTEDMKEKKRSPLKNRKAQGNVREKLSVIPLDSSRRPSGRNVLFGYDILHEEKRYYLFVGEKPSFHYIELLDHKGVTLDGCGIVPKLERRGFNKKGKGYIYKRLEPYNEAAARAELEAIKSIMTDGQRH